MSRRRQIAKKLEAYGDIRTMLSAMKSISMMELHKLGGQLERQRHILKTVEQVAADFLSFHDLPLETEKTLCIVIGSERGFCGDFNEDFLPAIEKIQARGDRLLLVGSRLAKRFSEEESSHNSLPGPNIAEEIPAALENVAHWLTNIQACRKGLRYHWQQKTATGLNIWITPCAA